MLVVALVLLVAGGATAGGVVLLGGDDESSEASDPTDPTEPTDEPTTDPTESPTTSPTTEPPPTTNPGTPTGELAAMESALSKRGFRCQLSFTDPVPVRTCYYDPYVAYGDAYVQTVVDQTGNAQWVEVVAHEVGEAKLVGKIMDRALDSLEGTILGPGDIRAIKQRPNAFRLKLTWGAGETYRGGADYLTVTLTKRGYRLPSIDLGSINVTPTDAMRQYKSKGYRCKVDPGFQSVDCERRKGKETYAASIFAECLRRSGGKLVPCPAQAPSMTAFWGGDVNRVTDAQVRRIVDDVFLPAARVALGGKEPAGLADWLRRGLDGDYHMADFGGLNFELDHNTAVTDRNAEVGLSVTYVDAPSLY